MLSCLGVCYPVYGIVLSCLWDCAILSVGLCYPVCGRCYPVCGIVLSCLWDCVILSVVGAILSVGLCYPVCGIVLSCLWDCAYNRTLLIRKGQEELPAGACRIHRPAPVGSTAPPLSDPPPRPCRIHRPACIYTIAKEPSLGCHATTA